MSASQRGLRLAVFVAAVALTGAQTLYPLQFAVDTQSVTARWVAVGVESMSGQQYAVPLPVPPPGPGARQMQVQTPFPADTVRSIAFSALDGEWNIASLALNGASWVAPTATGGAVVGSDPVEFMNLAAGPMIVAVQTNDGEFAGTYAVFDFIAEAGGSTCTHAFDGSKVPGGQILPNQLVVVTWWCGFAPEAVEDLRIVARTGGYTDSWEMKEVRMYRPASQWCTLNVAGTTTQTGSAIKGDWPDLPGSVDYVCLSPANECDQHVYQATCIEEAGCKWSTAGFCYHSCPPHYYGSACTTFCDAATTCTGKGSCDRHGVCQCQDGFGGVDCNEEAHTCTVWGDPHYTSFSGTKFDFHGVPTGSSPGAYVVYSIGKTNVVAQNYQCRGTTSSPKACMEQIRITSVGGTVVTVQMGNAAGTEKGLMHVTTPAGAAYTTDASAVSTFPVPVGDITLVSYRELNSVDAEFTFKLPAENGISAEVRVVQERSKIDNLPWVALYISHFGSMGGVSGLCAADCGQTDCEQFSTGFRLPGVPPLPITQHTGCTADPAGPLWANTCCSSLRTCAGEDLYNQCVTENCQMAWAGSVALSHCVDSFSRILLDSGLCEKQLCPGNRGGSGCLSCQQGYFGPDCNKYCDPAVTCNGHGSCNGAGDCWCDAGYTAVDPVTGIQCQAPGTPPATLPPVAVPTPAPTAAATLAPAPAGEGEGGPVCALFDTCTHDPNCCVTGSACMEYTEFYAQCREDCPTGWLCSAAGAPVPTAQAPMRPEDCLAAYPYGIPDGGACTDDPMCCADGLTCYEYGDSYAACMADCTLDGWRCTIRS